MFASAYRKAAAFTRPVIISHVREDGSCFGGAGSYVVVNKDGWILTAAHIFEEQVKLGASKYQLEQHHAAVLAIEADKGLLGSVKKKRIKALGKGKGVVNFSAWWGNGVTIRDVYGVAGADLAIGRLDPFNDEIEAYPVFKDPDSPIASGTSLCRLGFPFHEIHPTYDEAAGTFNLPDETFPMPLFPNEGILTRIRIADATGEIFAGFIETSSPGLRGQSGGPIFDQHGTVWGIQSQTAHLPLGFSPPVPGGRPEEKEHQFLNVGLGAHPASIVGLLNKFGVKHTLDTQ